MRIASCLLSVSIFALSTVHTQSADNSFQLLEVSGKVLVKTEQGTTPAKPGQSIAFGSSIFVDKDAVAHVAKADGACDLMLPTQMVTVINHTLCEPTISPTSSENVRRGLPPAAVGLAFFAAAAIVTSVTFAHHNNNPASSP